MGSVEAKPRHRGKRLPTLGHPSRTAAVKALLGQGKSRVAMAAELGIAPKNLASFIRQVERPDGAPRPGRPVGDTGGRPRASNVELNYEVARLLRPFAVRHDTTVPLIAREIVEAALDRGLIEQLLEGRF